MIHQAIVRKWGAGEWRTMDAATLAAQLDTPDRLQPATLIRFFGAVAIAGGNPAQLGQLWQFEEYVRRAETALAGGDRAGLLALIATIPVKMDGATLAAIQVAVAGLERSPIQAAEEGEEPPEVDAQGVATALEAAGWVWSGGQWVRQGG